MTVTVTVTVGTRARRQGTAILIIIEGPFKVFQRFFSRKLVLRTVESCLVALNYYENGSMVAQGLTTAIPIIIEDVSFRFFNGSPLVGWY